MNLPANAGISSPYMGVPRTAQFATPSSKIRPVVIVSIPFVSIILLNFFCQLEWTVEIRSAASLICFVAWLPMISHMIRRQAGLPFMPILSLIYGVYFGWVIFLEDEFFVPAVGLSLSDDIILRVEQLCLAGLVALIAGYYLCPERALQFLPRMKVSLATAQGIRISFFYAIVGIVFPQIQAQIPIRFQAIGQITEQFGALGTAMLFYYQLKGRLTSKTKFCLWGIFLPMRILYALIGGGVAPTIRDLLLFMGAFWFARQKWPWKTALVLALLILPIQGTKGEYRHMTWGTEMGTLDRAQVLVTLIREGVDREESFLYMSSMSMVHRLDYVTTFSAVVYLTPGVVPYWGGDSYTSFYWSLIPRLLYQDKPLKTLGQDFGHRYGLLGRTDQSTSWNLPQIVELYANFGPLGVVGGMFLIGLICRSIYYVFTDPSGGEAVALCSALVFSRLCSIESDFSLIYGGLVLNILALGGILKIMSLRFIHLPAGAFKVR